MQKSKPHYAALYLPLTCHRRSYFCFTVCSAKHIMEFGKMWEQKGYYAGI